MSFEGTLYKMCPDGHVSISCVYAPERRRCPVCRKRWRWEALFDETNGSSRAREKKEIGLVEVSPGVYQTPPEGIAWIDLSLD